MDRKCVELKIFNKHDCRTYFEQKNQNKKERINKKYKKIRYFNITYPSPLKDPFYQALILYFINLRNQANPPFIHRGDSPAFFFNDFSV